MTDYVLGLVPDYGLYVVFAVTVLACLAVPLPASMLVLAAGSFAAAGDLSLWQVLAVTAAAFILGDQLAFAIARRAGPRLLGRLRRRDRMDRLLSRSEDLLQQRGGVAVLLSHTILSPTCPYVSYLCGAGGMARNRFSALAIPGAVIWTLAYGGLGYVFADRLAQVSEVLSNFFGVVLAATAVALSLRWLLGQWKARQASVS
ncbi:VTT domain-containing protein [Paracoccus sp. 1_MG-2023]|uniref:DedA family protein n=1 Tax=unclassified Paracoccus (in: a-proteobacteria) TaxID=2688777 RepID=UPI001C08870A|nr:MULTISPECIES: VTT domain-containing protein [unclassified Paracoccus (in: a-proteobacteria)]MBU2957633.1 VTT domain-containing protein [Paracoccus sp. C2R09]MDO6667520.1 VTT domain-containing protein [Paracoccus sp. 1_MG-2023]